MASLTENDFHLAIFYGKSRGQYIDLDQLKRAYHARAGGRFRSRKTCRKIAGQLLAGQSGCREQPISAQGSLERVLEGNARLLPGTAFTETRHGEINEHFLRPQYCHYCITVTLEKIETGDWNE